MATFKQKPVEVEAVRFTGDNWHEVHEFTGHGRVNGMQQDLVREVPQPATIQAELWDKMHLCWGALHAGQWIVRGPYGEFTAEPGDDLAPVGYEPS
jgi:hypothetical protein